ncbi:Peroxidase, active site [Sesbania bispinosa]|nr:Peroxidase, active site [Sesbania bispinosa]
MSSILTDHLLSIATASDAETDFPAKLQRSSFSTVKFHPDKPNDHGSSDVAVSFSSSRRRICIATLPCLLPLTQILGCLRANAMQPGTKEYLLIKEEVRKVLSKGKAAGVLRLVFHDAGTFEVDDNIGGMNGSIVYELERPENAGLKKSVLQKAKTQIDAIQPVSWADMIAVAGAEAVEICGGPPIQVSLGRQDSLEPDPEGKLPEETLDASGLKKCFKRKGFSIDNLEVRFDNLERGFENLLEMAQNINQTLQQKGNSSGDSSNGAEGNLGGRNESRSGTVEEPWRRLEILLFSGDDAYGWVNRVERYFNLKGVLEQERLQAVMVAMEGKTLSWFRWWRFCRSNPSWEDFKAAVISKFQPEFDLDIRVQEDGSESWEQEYRGKNETLKFKNEVVAEKEKEKELELHVGTVVEVQEADVANKIEGQESDADLGDIKTKKECFKECFKEDFHSKVSEAAKRLHLKEHLVLDGSGNVFKLAAPVECKGIVGGDDRHYLLDLLRAQAAETSKSKEKNSEGADDLASDSQNAIDADKPDITEEEKTEDVKELTSSSTEASGYLCTLEVSPMDGQTFKQKLEAGLGEAFKGSWLQESLRGFSFDPGGTWLSAATSYSP